MARCGSNAESFRWKDFAQLFSSWLLPWLALISQLPFGSGNYVDDFVSAVMNVGSPALTTYSLVLTALNARLVYRRAQHIKHGSSNAVARALISLQQIPLELTRDDCLLAFVPINDQWRREIDDRLSRPYAWSVATGSSVAWVLIAFIFTLFGSFVSLEFSADDGSEGHAVGTLWLWLLCLVIGWLWVPTFTRGELKSAIGHANKKAAKNSTKRIKQKAAKAYNSAKTKITNRLPKRMSIRKGFKKPVVDLPEVPEENGSEKMKAGLVQVDTKPVWQQTEEKPDPIPNPAHDRSTVSFQEPTESQHGHSHNVSANPTANYSISSLPHSAAIHSFAAPSSIRETDRLLILKDEFNSLHRDELRFSATFNYSRIMRYLTLVDDVLGALDRLAREKEEVGLLRKRLFLEVVTPITDSPQRKRPISEITATHPAEGVVFPPGALRSMFIASIFALILQCGTTAAAIVIMVLTPTFGLGCRSLGYVLYGGISTLILFLTIISTTLARISETRVGPSTTCSVKGITAFVAVALRRVSLLLALTNATGLVVLSCLQFSKVLNTCYCNASVIGQGTGSYTLISFEGWIPTMRTARVSASILAAACMGVYMIFLWLMTALPREIDQF